MLSCCFWVSVGNPPFNNPLPPKSPFKSESALGYPNCISVIDLSSAKIDDGLVSPGGLPTIFDNLVPTLELLNLLNLPFTFLKT